MFLHIQTQYPWISPRLGMSSRGLKPLGDLWKYTYFCYNLGAMKILLWRLVFSSGTKTQRCVGSGMETPLYLDISWFLDLTEDVGPVVKHFSKIITWTFLIYHHLDIWSPHNWTCILIFICTFALCTASSTKWFCFLSKTHSNYCNKMIILILVSMVAVFILLENYMES